MEFNGEESTDTTDEIDNDITNNDQADLSKFIDGIQRAEEIRVILEKSTVERAVTVQEMVKEKEKPPSLIKSIIERLNGN